MHARYSNCSLRRSRSPRAWERPRPSRLPECWVRRVPRRPSMASGFPTRPEVRWDDQGKGFRVEGLVGTTRRAAEGCAQRAADHDRRQRVRRPGYLRWRRSDPGDGSHRQGRAALHELPLHVAVLAVARSLDHGTQSSCRRIRRRGRDRNRVPGLQLGHPEGERHHRRHPEGQRLRDLVVRQESQHPLLSSDTGRSLRPVAERHGLRVLLWLRRR